jgi:hypothetical protein
VSAQVRQHKATCWPSGLIIRRSRVRVPAAPPEKTADDLRERLMFKIFYLARICGCMWPEPVICGSLYRTRAEDHLGRHRRLASPSWPTTHLAQIRSNTSPLSGPLRHRGRVNATVEPRGQAGVPKVVRPPREWRCLLGFGEGHLACLDSRPAVDDRGQFAAVHAAEEGGRRGQCRPRPPSPVLAAWRARRSEHLPGRNAALRVIRPRRGWWRALQLAAR